MSLYVLDSSAIIAHITAEKGGDTVNRILKDAKNYCYAHSINICKVYYNGLRRKGKDAARQAINEVISDGLIERNDIDRSFWEATGELKSRGRIAIADCFTVVLAQKLSATIVTSDHHEFDPLVPLNLVAIQFIR